LQQARPDQYPDYHFLLIAPNLGGEWLFDAARVYWDRYRPTIINDFNFVFLIPTDKTIIITVVARRDTASQLGVQLAQQLPNAFFDPVIFDQFDDIRKALNDRAILNTPFGVAISQPTPTLDPNAPIIPTPRLFPTNPPAGFITQSPPTPSPAPTLSPVPSQDQPQPIVPTPGSVVGGGG
jgi:hypothetical protein